MSEDLYAYARLIAGELRRRWSGMDVDDITQEICVYVLGNEKVSAEWENYCEGDYVDRDAERHAANRMRLICRRAGERYCRRERAAQLGYSPEDEAFYSVKQLAELVEQFYQAGITERPPIGRSESVRQPVSDPASGGGWLVSMLDVERGLGLIQAKYRNRLRFRYKDMGEHSTKDLVAMVGNLAVAKGKRERIERILGATESTMRGRVRQALRKLQSALGGPNPWVREDLELAA